MFPPPFIEIGGGVPIPVRCKHTATVSIEGGIVRVGFKVKGAVSD